MVPWLPFFITFHLPLSLFLLLFIPRTPMDRLFADGASLPGLSEPGVHTAAMIGYGEEYVKHLVSADGAGAQAKVVVSP